MRSRATTASWHSPRTSWNSLARSMKRSTSLSPARRHQLGGVPRALGLDPDLVQGLVGRLVAQPPHGLAQALERIARHALQRDVGIGDLRLARRVLERSEQLEVALAPESGHELLAPAASLCFEGADQQGAATGVGGIEGGDLVAQVLAQDVEIAHGPQLIAEPADLLAERLHPRRGPAWSRPRAAGCAGAGRPRASGGAARDPARVASPDHWR